MEAYANSTWLDPTQLALLLTTAVPQPQRNGGGQMRSHNHISCVSMRPEVEPAFCCLPGREPTIPTLVRKAHTHTHTSL